MTTNGASEAAPRSKGTSKLEPVPRPNEKAFKEQMDTETKAIEEIRSRISQLQEKISSVVGGRDEYNRKKGEMRSKLDQLQNAIEELEDKRKDLLNKIQSKQKESAEMKQSATELRRKIGYSSAEDIDKKIAALEHAMVTSTLSLKDEKQMIEEIKKLKNSKPLLGHYKNMEMNASQFEDVALAPMRSSLDEIRTKLLELRNQKREEALKYKELMDSRQAATAPGRDLFEERDRLSKEMSEHISRRRAIQEELNRENYRYQVYVRLLKKENDEKMREERARRQLENEREDLLRELERVENDVPYEDECNLLQQTITYLNKILAEYKDESPQTVKEESKPDAQLAGKLEGKVLVPKSEREQFFFAPTASKKKSADHVEKKKPKSKAIRYDIGTLNYFERCGVTAPVLFDEIPKSIEELQVKYDKFKSVQEDMSQKVDSRRAIIEAQIKALDDKVAQYVLQQERMKMPNATAQDAAE